MEAVVSEEDCWRPLCKDGTIKIIWMKFGNVSRNIYFVGKDVVAITDGLHVLFYDLVEKRHKIYKANSTGVSCIAGYKVTPLFAFAEKCLHPRILVMEYPTFATITTIPGVGSDQILALTFAEMEYLISLGSLPNYEITVWSWRSGDKLTSEKTGIISVMQLFRCSPSSPPVVAQIALDYATVVLWEIHTCCKNCLLTRLEFNVESAKSPCRFTWSPDGVLIIIDATGKVFMIEVEKRKLQHIFNWTGSCGDMIPYISWHKGGVVVAGPDGDVKHFKRMGPTEWEITWSVIPEDTFTALITCLGKDYIIGFSNKGHLYQFVTDDEGPKFLKLATYGRNYTQMCFINPLGEYLATLDSQQIINTWSVDTGEMMGEYLWKQRCLSVVSNPVLPYLALGRQDGIMDFINMFTPGEPKLMTQVYLCHDGISGLEVSSRGTHVIPCIMDSGLFFVIKSDPGELMNIKSYIHINEPIAQFTVTEETAELNLTVLIKTTVCCSSGDKLNVYSVRLPTYEFYLIATISLPDEYSGFFANPLTSDQYYGVPHNSRQIHILKIKKQQLILVDAKQTGHQVRKYNMLVTEDNIITYGFDGEVILHSLDTFEHLTCVMTHHYCDLGIKKVIINALNTHIVTLGHDGSLVCNVLPFQVDKERQESLTKVMSDPHICSSFTTRRTSGFMSSTGLNDSKTWFELQEEIKLLQEKSRWSKEKELIYEEFKALQKACVDLLMKNHKRPPEEQLPISAFDLDQTTRDNRVEETHKICKKTDEDLKALIFAQNKLCEALKKRFWDPVEVKGRKLRAIMGKGEVESYPVFQPDLGFEEEINWVKERRNLEVQMFDEDNFQPWQSGEDDEPESSIIQKASLGGIKSSAVNIREALSSVTSVHEMEEEEDRVMKVALSGSTSHEFVSMFPNHHSQFEIISYLQLRNEIILLMNVTNNLRQYFNERFNTVFSFKEREMVLVKERNSRLRYILSELKDTQTEVVDPVWTQDEQPERIMTVEDKEVPVSPYISPKQQKILDKLAAEAEALRLALLADNFRELALIIMMDGVLEVRWEDEIKKDVPKPKCMLEKNPEDYTEEDLRTIKDYEEKVVFRLSERERYRKMLGAEFKKLSQTLKDNVLKFNGRLADLLLLKLKIESAIGHENLKMIRGKVAVEKLTGLNNRKKQLKVVIKDKEVSNVALQEKIHQLQIWTNDCRNVYEALVTKDKNLEKNFRKEFPEDSQAVMEQLTKFYKRRPKIQQKAQMSVTLLNELSRCTTSTERPSFLPLEYLEFLKALDQMDHYSNSPPIVNEELWNILCRVRRQKLECELKTRSAALEVAESEQTVNLYQKRLTNEKLHFISLQDELQKTRDKVSQLVHNTEIQIVMKGGLIEVKTTGSHSDFDDAVLISRDKVEAINDLVRKAGKQKLAAMYRVSSFHRGILAKEWEHKKLKMEIEDLEDHLHNLESMKVTKDIQMFLCRRVKGMNEDKVILSLEKEVAMLKESYENIIKDLQARINELYEKTEKQRKENRKLDAKITEVNVDVSEQQLQRDMEYETRQDEMTKERMASIVKRSQLVALIQKQHSEILALQTELELLRLKTYPTLKYKTLI